MTVFIVQAETYSCFYTTNPSSNILIIYLYYIVYISIYNNIDI